MLSQNQLILANWDDQRFKDPELIAKGAYSWVYKCNDTQTGRYAAVKFIPDIPELRNRVARDTDVLHEVNHPNCVRVIFLRRELECVKLAMEFVNSNLERYLKDFVTVDAYERKSFMFQILQGLYHCHSLGYVHCNVIPSHLLLLFDSDDDIIKITGFSNSRKRDDPPPADLITRHRYSPPEILLHWPEITSAADIWSLGCIFAEMIKGSPLFAGPHELYRLWVVPNVQAGPGEGPPAALPPRELALAETFPDLEPNALNLLTRMIRFQPGERISVADALRHPYFEDVEYNV